MCVVALAFAFLIQEGSTAHSPQSVGQSTKTRVPVIELPEFPQLCKEIKQQAKGKLLVVSFWDTRIDLHLKYLVELDNKYRSKGVKIVVFSVDDNYLHKRSVIPSVIESKASFDVFLIDDSNYERKNEIIRQEWLGEELETIPTIALFDRQGKRVYLQAGGLPQSIKPDPLETAIELALKQ